MKAAVIGLGSMGMGAALSLVRAGHDVTGVELRQAAWAELEAAGGRCVASASEIGAADAAIIFVVNAAQADAVLSACLDGLAPGAVVINCVTLAPELARSFADRVAATGRLYLDAPVSGGSVAAREGRMSIMAAGADEAFAAAQPLLDGMATKVWRLGTEPGVGSTVKMVNQLLAGVHIAVAAEAMALGIRAGADPQTLFDVISNSAGSSWMWQNRMPHVLAGDDTPHSAVNIFVKDLGIVLDQARALTFPLPMASAAHQLFLAAAAGGYGGRDDAFVIRVWEQLTGIELPNSAPE